MTCTLQAWQGANLQIWDVQDGMIVGGKILDVGSSDDDGNGTEIEGLAAYRRERRAEREEEKVSTSLR